MAETIKVLVSEEEVEKRIRDLGEKISKDYEEKQVHLICVLKGGVFFMCELAKKNYRSDFYGLYERKQLWRWNDIQRSCQDRKRSG